MTQHPVNTESLARFARQAHEIKNAARPSYDRLLAADLSRQRWDGCFQRNVLAVLAQVYDQTAHALEALPFTADPTPLDRGMSALTKLVLAEFDGFIEAFLAYVVDKHRTSCALSNFPDEHKPDRDYLEAVKRDIAQLWREFAVNVNNRFLALTTE